MSDVLEVLKYLNFKWASLLVRLVSTEVTILLISLVISLYHCGQYGKSMVVLKWLNCFWISIMKHLDHQQRHFHLVWVENVLYMTIIFSSSQCLDTPTHLHCLHWCQLQWNFHPSNSPNNCCGHLYWSEDKQQSVITLRYKGRSVQKTSRTKFHEKHVSISSWKETVRIRPSWWNCCKETSTERDQGEEGESCLDQQTQGVDIVTFLFTISKFKSKWNGVVMIWNTQPMKPSENFHVTTSWNWLRQWRVQSCFQRQRKLLWGIKHLKTFSVLFCSVHNSVQFQYYNFKVSIDVFGFVL